MAHERPPDDHALDAHTMLRRELKVVGDIQQSLLPENLPEIPGIQIAACYRPSATAGGDYFDIVPLTQGRWGLVIADVAGHGASAAVIMAVMRTLVHAHLPHTRSLPARAFLEFLNRQMTGVYARDGRFVTLWCAILDPTQRRVTYASAGHNPPRLVRGQSVAALDAVGGFPIGIEDSAVYEELSVSLMPGDVLAIYTDGITEAMRSFDAHRELFETRRLDETLLDVRSESAQACVRRVITAVDAFTGSRAPADDQTLLVIKLDGSEPPAHGKPAPHSHETLGYREWP